MSQLAWRALVKKKASNHISQKLIHTNTIKMHTYRTHPPINDVTV